MVSCLRLGEANSSRGGSAWLSGRISSRRGHRDGAVVEPPALEASQRGGEVALRDVAAGQRWHCPCCSPRRMHSVKDECRRSPTLPNTDVLRWLCFVLMLSLCLCGI